MFKSDEACDVLYKSEYFHPKSGEFKRGKFTIVCTVEDGGIWYEGLDLDGNVESREFVPNPNRKGS